MGFFDTLKAQTTSTLEWLPMLYNDPGLLISIIETSKSLIEHQIIRIDESLIERKILEECVSFSKLSINDLACCGLQSNRLLLYGTIQEKGLAYEFIAFITPAKDAIVWTEKAWTVCFDIDGPKMQATNLPAELLGNVTDFVCGTLIPGIAYEVIKKAFEKTFESMTKQRWISSISEHSSSIHKIGKNSIVVDLLQNDSLRSLIGQEITIPQTNFRLTLAELLQIQDITIDKNGIGVKVVLKHQGELTKYLSGILKQ